MYSLCSDLMAEKRLDTDVEFLLYAIAVQPLRRGAMFLYLVVLNTCKKNKKKNNPLIATCVYTVSRPQQIKKVHLPIINNLHIMIEMNT